jgi:hypothetical protein
VNVDVDFDGDGDGDGALAASHVRSVQSGMRV